MSAIQTGCLRRGFLHRLHAHLCTFQGKERGLVCKAAAAGITQAPTLSPSPSRLIFRTDAGHPLCIWWVAYLVCPGGFESRNYYNAKMPSPWLFLKLGHISLTAVQPPAFSFPGRWPSSKPVLQGETMVWNWVKLLSGSFYFNLRIL